MVFDLYALWEKIEIWLELFFDTVLEGLPVSPVSNYVTYIESFPYLGYLNWFVPVGTCVEIMAGWLVCVGGYYLYSVIMRWCKIIGS